MKTRNLRTGLAAVLVLVLVAGIVVVLRGGGLVGRTQLVAYFDNSNGIFVGDEVRIVGVPVGEIDRIEPQPTRVKISFWLDDQYKVPADAKAVILSPSLVTSRAIQLTPAYTRGPVMADHTVIPQERTAVPTPCNRPSRAESARWARWSTPPLTTCAARAPPSATRSSNSPRRSQRSATTATTCSPR